MALQRWNKNVQHDTGNFLAPGQDPYGYYYTFPTVGQGSVALVTVAVPGSPAGAQWDVYIGGQFVGSGYGAVPIGPLFLSGGDVVTMQSAPNVSFVNDPGGAVAVGVVGDKGEIPPAAITSAGGLPVGLNIAGSYLTSTISAGSLTSEISLTTNARGLLVVSSTTPTSPPEVAGNFIPVSLGAMNIQYGGADSLGVWWLGCPFLSELQIQFASTPAAWLAVEVDYDFDWVEVARSLGVYSVAVPEPAAATDWTYTLPAPARPVSIVGTFEAAGANRYPTWEYADVSGGPVVNPSFRSSGGIENGSGTTLILTAPAGIVAGDQLIAFMGIGVPGTITPPAGWSLLTSIAAAGADDVSYAYTKTATGAEPGTYTWTSTSTGQWNPGVVLAYENAEVDIYGTATNGASGSASIIAPSVTTTEAEDIIICAYSNEAFASSSAALPVALTSRANNSPSGANAPVAVGDFVQVAAGATPTQTATVTNQAYWSAITVALKTSSAGPTTTVLAKGMFGNAVFSTATAVCSAFETAVPMTVGALATGPLSSQLLPAGTVIESATAGIGSGDQWSGVELTVAPI